MDFECFASKFFQKPPPPIHVRDRDTFMYELDHVCSGRGSFKELYMPPLFILK